MPYKQKQTIVTLVNFSLILLFILTRLYQLNRSSDLTSSNIFRLWGVTIVMAIIVSIATTIITQIVSAIVESITSGNEEPEVDFFEDERDNLIDLKGNKTTYLFSSIGTFLAMLTFVFGQPPLVMFTLLIIVGVVAQIMGDITRLNLYRSGPE